jgi:hypothetical protein
MLSSEGGGTNGQRKAIRSVGKLIGIAISGSEGPVPAERERGAASAIGEQQVFKQGIGMCNEEPVRRRGRASRVDEPAW